MSQKTSAIYWFNHDLRVHDNAALTQAANTASQLYCVYCIDPKWLRLNRYGLSDIGPHRLKFLWQSLHSLSQQLERVGQKLHIIDGSAIYSISNILKQNNFTHVFSSNHSGWYENQQWQILKKSHPDIKFNRVNTHTLFLPNELPFSLEELPDTFSQFRQRTLKSIWQRPILTITSLPDIAILRQPYAIPLAEIPLQLDSAETSFQGGEMAALRHLHHYMNTNLPSHYKDVRNKLDGWDNSSKLSAWLANGSLSVRQVLKSLKNYEQINGTSESTQWIYLELLWREYFQWYALKRGKKLFSFNGTRTKISLTKLNSKHFEKWCQGNTAYPIVNACIHQLNDTGYLSNRGRQIAASCLVNELSLDWRYGAAYFEQMLIDYDVAINWGNWQYIAGVGTDAKEKQYFDLNKQTQKFDPSGAYIRKWNGQTKSKEQNFSGTVSSCKPASLNGRVF